MSLIQDLPGLPAEATFNQYAGYLPVSETKNAFYWFVESQNDPANDPLVLWTNGGPGCSGLGGFLTEQGPFRPTADGGLVMNPASWNTVANMVFIEQPCGVGFSYSSADEKFSAGDDQAAIDNRAFIDQFIGAYPQFADNDFYISSESYGGHYMPTLAKELVVNGSAANFKGFLVGNPLTYMPYRDYGQYGTYAGHQLLPKPVFDKYLSAGCDADDSSETCGDLMSQFDDLTANLDPYAIDFPVCAGDESTGLAAGREERHRLLSTMRRAGGRVGSYFPDAYEPCEGDWAADYLNRDDVQAAIHARANSTWSMCGDIDYSDDDTLLPMMPIYNFLIDGDYDLNILVFSGDDDSICATLGSQQFIWDLGYDIKSDWAPWTMDEQLAGYHVEFEGFHFATVHGAGHMVPQTRPDQALELFKKFLSGEW